MADVNLISDTVSELSTTYLSSTLPKPIKKILYKIHTHKLKKIIDKIPDNKITFEILVELCNDIFNRYYSYSDKSAKFENMTIKIGNYDENPPFINNNSEYNILINISENFYARILLQSTNDYKSPGTYISAVTIRTNDVVLNRPISFSNRNFDKYQEISEDIINRISITDRLSQQAVDSYKLVLQILCNNLKKYLNNYIGVYDKINL